MYNKIFSAGNCLSLDELGKYLSNRLRGRQLHAAEKHLMECELCAEVVTGMDSKDLAIIRNISSNVNKKVTAITGYKPTPPFLSGSAPYILSVIVLVSLLGTYTAIKIADTPQEPVSENNIIIYSDDDDIDDNSKNALLIGKEEQEPVAEPVDKSDIRSPEAIRKQNVTDNISNKENITERKNEIQESRQEDPVDNNDLIQEKNEKDNVDNNIAKGDPNKPFDNSGMDNRTHNLQSVTVEVIDKQSVIVTGGSTGKNKNGQLGSGKTGKQVKGSFRLDEMPEFAGGDVQLKAYMKNEIKSIIKKHGNIEKGSTAYVSFVVTSKGRIEDVEPGRGVPEEIQDDVIQAIKDMPRWKPAKKKGKIRCVLSITFD